MKKIDHPAGAGANKIRIERAEIQTETTLDRLVRSEEENLARDLRVRLVEKPPLHPFADPKSPLEQLTSRQREVLRLIADGHSTKQIAEILSLSPKTVEYHRMKLMDGLNVHHIPGLVRFALRAGVVPLES